MKKINSTLLLHEAREDLENAKIFYDERELGIGDYFIDCLLSDISSLKIYSGIHQKHFAFFRMLSKRFPFAIYYDIESDSARIVAILDMRINPNTISGILQTRNPNKTDSGASANASTDPSN